MFRQSGASSSLVIIPPKSRYGRARVAALNVADVVVFVGSTYKRCGATEEEWVSGRFFRCETVKEADEFLKANVTKSDLVLLKSSRSVHLERLAHSFSTGCKCWIETCGLRCSCRTCKRHIPQLATSAEED